jgi:hypothetical protein
VVVAQHVVRGPRGAAQHQNDAPQHRVNVRHGEGAAPGALLEGVLLPLIGLLAGLAHGILGAGPAVDAALEAVRLALREHLAGHMPDVALGAGARDGRDE